MLPKMVRLRRITRGVVLATLLTTGCQKAATPASAPAPTPTHDESSLAKVFLAADQVKSLNIQADPARKEKVQDRRRLNGWILAAQGHEVVLTAPVAGYVRAPKTGQIPIVGYPVEKGQQVLTIDPILTPLEQVQLAS